MKRDANSKASDGAKCPLVHKLWRDHEIKAFVYESRCAPSSVTPLARSLWIGPAKTLFGEAVADTGIKGDHPHFQTHQTLKLPNGLKHFDFTETYTDLDLADAAAPPIPSGTEPTSRVLSRARPLGSTRRVPQAQRPSRPSKSPTKSAPGTARLRMFRTASELN